MQPSRGVCLEARRKTANCSVSDQPAVRDEETGVTESLRWRRSDV